MPAMASTPPVIMAGLRPSVSAIRPAGHRHSACAAEPARKPMPIHSGPRCSPSTTNSGISELRTPKSIQPVPRLVTSAAR